MCKARDVPGFVVFATFPRRRCAWTGYWWWCGLWVSRRRCAWTGYWWWCGLWVSRRRCAWPGYWLVVRPVG
ncbi:hypothetical protein [Klebsiella aerogenes]|uniref:hypothetical protein n=1 Tax=Klebsiella aerogenes TaxID=548 RepID=UPI00290E196C|nr:hypothetical protein [Klebsiella aerogenes]